MSRAPSALSQFRRRLNSRLLRSGWPVQLIRLLGVRPSVVTTEHHVQVKSWLDAPSTGLRIAFASDFHAGPTTDPAVLEAACVKLRELAPDVLLLGGDFVGLEADQIHWLGPLLGDIPAPLGRYAVLGNHDWWTDAAHVAHGLEAAGVRVLTNRNVRLPAPFQDVWLCGLDDDCHGEPDGEAALRGADGIRVVLMHSPSAVLALDQARFELAVCGHTHGGQIALPGGIPILLPAGPLSRRYARGRFDLGAGRTMIVSVGLGCGGLPIRTFAPPEVLLCTITGRGASAT